MKKRIRVLFALIMGLLIGLVLTACGGSPTIAIAPVSADLGDIAPTVPVSTTVQLRNDGVGALTIIGLRTSCGCTTATVTSESVAGGQATDLVITFDPQAHPGLYGELMRIVYVETNDPKTPELEIPVTVNVLTPEEAKK